MDEQREWLKRRRKRRLRVLGAVLCFSVLVANFPSILDTLSVDAALSDGAWEQSALQGMAQMELSLPETPEAAFMEDAGGEVSEDGGNTGRTDTDFVITGEDNQANPETPNEGSPVPPETPDGENPVNPATPDEGSLVSPVTPDEGSPVKPATPDEGSPVNPGNPDEGSPADAETPNEENPVTPETSNEENPVTPETPNEGNPTDPVNPDKEGETDPENSTNPMTSVEGDQYDQTNPAEGGQTDPANPVEGEQTKPGNSNTMDQFTVSFFEDKTSTKVWKTLVVKTGERIDKPTPDLKEGHTFVKWVDNDGNDFDFGLPITASVSVYAEWKAESYTVSFVIQGDSEETNPPSLQVIYGEEYGTLPTPVKEGYMLDCWYMNANCTGDRIKKATKVTTATNHTLYAKWVQITDKTEFEITYYDMDGSLLVSEVKNPTSYTQVTNTFTLRNPTRTGYTFDGWTGTELSEQPTKTVTVKKGSTGRRDYYANWTPNSYVVTFQYNGATSGNSEKKRPVTYDDYYGTPGALPSPEKKGCYFIAWYLDSACKDEEIVEKTIVTTAKNHTLYAKWMNEDGTYTVTLKDGKGYTLKAQSGKASHIEPGSNFTFVFKLKDNYRKKSSFAVMLNGTKVKLTSKDTYTIKDIDQNVTVTVTGVEEEIPDENQAAAASDNQTGDGSSDSGASSSVTAQPQAVKPVKPSPKQEASPAAPENNADQASAKSSGSTSKSRPAAKKQIAKSIETGDWKKSISRLTGRFAIGGGALDTSPDTDEEVDSQPNTEQDDRSETRTDGEVVLSLPAAVEDGRIVLSGEPVPAGNVTGMLGSAAGAKSAGTTLDLKSGSVTVKVMSGAGGCKAGVADTAAVANAVLTPQQIQRADNGENIEIKIEVKDISAEVTEQERNIIADGLDAFAEELPGLTVGMYTDISVFTKSDSGEWNAIADTEDKIEMVIGIPQSLLRENRAYYVIRVHDGGYTLLNDRDETADTITVSTDRFSSYAVVFRELGGQADGGHTCRLCHICPTFLGSCCFLWMALGVAFCSIVALLLRKRENRGEVRPELGK